MYKPFRIRYRPNPDFTPRENQVHDLMLKNLSPEEIAKEIKSISAVTAQRYIWRVLKKERDGGGPPSPPGLLTARQQEVLDLIKASRKKITNQQIADRLIVSRGTVGKYIYDICRKLGVTRKKELYSD
jgi:DNA-binding CsgD family transcriptional regulator